MKTFQGVFEVFLIGNYSWGLKTRELENESKTVDDSRYGVPWCPSLIFIYCGLQLDKTIMSSARCDP